MEKNIEYGAYISLNWNYAPPDMRVNFLEYFQFLLNSDFSGLEKLLLTTLELDKFPQRSDDELIEGILAYSIRDLKKKRAKRNYYECNAICVLNVIKKIFTNDLYKILQSDGSPQLVQNTYRYILKQLLMDAQELCILYNTNIKRDKEYSCNIDSRYIHFMPLHQVLRQTLYTSHSYHSFSDLEICASIPVIRQLIEIRLRRAFGCMAYIDENENLIPLDMSTLFESIKKHRAEITFPINLQSIERIYKWSNQYVHSGKEDFSWIPYFLEFVLRPLSFGNEDKRGFDIKNGIVTTPAVINQIYQELFDNVAQKHETTKLKLYTCNPECRLITE